MLLALPIATDRWNAWVFLDVESMPDRDFYYLIGLRCQAQELPVQWSFWANNSTEEYDIWHQCIRVLRGINNPRIVHYGAYETRFLKLMKDRWKSSDNDPEFVQGIVEGSLNLLSVMYGAIYFPTYSNSLKDIARWLGFDWELEHASGSTAILLRRCWELTGEDEFRRKLIAYNADDCRAAAIVFEALSHVCGSGDASGGMNRETVNVASLEVPFQRTFGKFPSALPEFEKINRAAYWDYQRSKVYVRTNKTIRRSIERTIKRSKETLKNSASPILDRRKSISWLFLQLRFRLFSVCP